MKTIPCTSDETLGFENISDFLYPEGQLDEQALGLFLKSYGRQTNGRYYYHHRDMQEQKQMAAMGYLLRLIDSQTPLWFETFQNWYTLYRMEGEAYIGVWFGLLDEDHREEAKQAMLKMLSGAPPIDIRVTLMMDGMEHYPDLPVQTFVGKSLLRVKSASFVKALRPRIAQMPMVLRMAKELKEAAPEYSELAQAITMGVFVQRMADKPSDANPQSEYSVCEALLLVLDHGVVPEDTGSFVKSAKSRFKGSSLLPDMMRFVTWALNTDPSRNWLMRTSSEKEKTFAKELMLGLLAEKEKEENYDSTFDGALMQAYALSSHEGAIQTKLKEWFANRILAIGNKKAQMESSTFVYLLDHVETVAHNHMWEQWCKFEQAANTLELIKKYIQKGSSYYDSYRYFELLRGTADANDIVNCLHEEAQKSFNAEKVMAGASVYNNDSEEGKKKSREQHFFRIMTMFFERAQRLVTPEIRGNESFKKLVAATSLSYLFHGGQSQYIEYTKRNGDFINLLAEPLPLLRTMYPEHTTALNQLRKDVIAGLEKSEDNTMYYRALYNVLGRALYAETSLSFEVVSGMMQAMGIDALEYFQACALQKEVHFEVSSDLFDMSM